MSHRRRLTTAVAVTLAGVVTLTACSSPVAMQSGGPASGGTHAGTTTAGAAASTTASATVGPAAPAATVTPTGPGQPPCDGWAQWDTYNPADQVMDDVLTVRGFEPVDIGTAGDIDWAQDPYHHPSWQLWLHGLRWLGHLIASDDPAEVARAVTITQDWLADNDPNHLSQAALAGSQHRAQVLVCLSYKVGLAPWLVDALELHAQLLGEHFSGDWNHGMDESAALFAVGCRLRRQDVIALADQRMADMTPHIIDAQGATNEQATGYAAYVYARLTTLQSVWQACGRSLPAELLARQRRMPAFLAHATTPDGTLVQLGDTEAVPADIPPGTIADYALSRGATGTPPTNRVAIYQAGYVFGRSHWAPFGTASYYSLRFGPKRAIHGHYDHGSLTWYARGHPILIDTGHIGYDTGPRRDHVRSPQAHNVMTIPGGQTRNPASTLTRKTVSDRADVFEVRVPAYRGATWRRTALITSSGIDAMVVYDRLPTAATKTTAQYWHLPPGTQVVTGPGRANALSADGQVRTRIVQIPLPGQQLPARDTTVVTGRTTPSPLGWYAPEPEVWQPAPVVVANRREANTRALTVITATAPNATQSTQLRNLGGGRYQLTVTVGNQRLVVEVTSQGWLVRR